MKQNTPNQQIECTSVELVQFSPFDIRMGKNTKGFVVKDRNKNHT